MQEAYELDRVTSLPESKPLTAKQLHELIMDCDKHPYGRSDSTTQCYEFPFEGFYAYAGKLAKQINSKITKKIK